MNWIHSIIKSIKENRTQSGKSKDENIIQENKSKEKELDKELEKEEKKDKRRERNENLILIYLIKNMKCFPISRPEDTYWHNTFKL